LWVPYYISPGSPGSLTHPIYLDLEPINTPFTNSTHMIYLSLVNRATTQSSKLPSIFCIELITVLMNWEHGVCLDWLIKSIIWINVMYVYFYLYVNIRIHYHTPNAPVMGASGAIFKIPVMKWILLLWGVENRTPLCLGITTRSPRVCRPVINAASTYKALPIGSGEWVSNPSSTFTLISSG